MENIRRQLADILPPWFPRSTGPMLSPENDPGYEDRRQRALQRVEEEMAAAGIQDMNDSQAQQMRTQLYKKFMQEMAGE